MRHERRWFCIFLLILGLSLGSCSKGGGGGGQEVENDPAQGSTWDQMVWDKGKWG